MSMKDESLLNTDQVSESEDTNLSNSADPNKLSFRFKIVLGVLVALSAIVFAAAIAINRNEGSIATVLPIKIRIALPEQSPFPILLGESRVFEALLYSGNDDRRVDSYQSVTEREVIWSVDPQGIASVDAYGRLATIKAGTVTVRVQSKQSADVYA
jgi:hypothetical protein